MPAAPSRGVEMHWDGEDPVWLEPGRIYITNLYGETGIFRLSAITEHSLEWDPLGGQADGEIEMLHVRPATDAEVDTVMSFLR